MTTKTFNDLLDLFQDGIDGNKERFTMRLRKISSKLNKESPELAQKINLLLEKDDIFRAKNQDIFTPPPLDSDTRQHLLIINQNVKLPYKPILDETIYNEIARVLIEHSKKELLLTENLIPTRSMLMSGPPGVGKTMTANYIAEKLNLPLLTLDLATVMSSYLGKTGNNIRSVLKYAQSFPCVLFFDEFDAIAKKRDDDSDVGELKRLVTVLLQAIDEWPTDSILLAATNHAGLLDKAIWRRFDKIIKFNFPTKEQISKYLFEKNVESDLANWIAEQIENISFSNIEKNLNHARKNSILENKFFNETLCEQFELDINSYYSSFKDKHEEWIKYLSSKKLTQQKIADAVGISRATVSRVIKKYKG